MPTAASPEVAAQSAPLAPWAALVCKDRVGLGVLPQAQQRLALALVWSALPQLAVHTERQINQLLQAALGGPACWLATDHVELRRWLVDAGWLRRDGFGREYRVVAWDQLAPALQAVASPLRGLDSAAWVAGRRAAARAERERRRLSWQGKPQA